MAHYARCAGAEVTVADLKEVVLPDNITYLDGNDEDSVRRAINESWCIVSVTGLAGALKRWAVDLVKSSAIIANMGVEDEFGGDVPVSRVLNEKLLFETLPSGINFPPRELEKSIVADIKNGGIIAAEMEFIISELD